MKMILLCLCFLLCGCTQSFKNNNMNLNQLKIQLQQYCEVPMMDNETQINSLLQSHLQTQKDKLVLISPFSYPKEIIIIVHSEDEKWKELFQQYINTLKSEIKELKNNQYYEEYTKIGKIYEYQYLIVSKQHQDIINYLLGK